MINNKPTIMVSSTFFDLRQIRADLHRFIEDDLGYASLLSELPSFPVDPDLDTVENCRQKVNENADIFILVIGGRYGSIDSKSNKSITNLEFSAARTKGIPIYVFIDESILSILQVWKSNPTGNFENIVDTTAVFEFIETVRSKEKVWSFGFKSAQDIIYTLRIQIAYLFKSALDIRKRMTGPDMPSYQKKISPRALKLAMEKPTAWEYRLFLQALLDEVDARNDILRQYKAGLQLEPAIFISASKESIGWLRTKTHELENLIDSAAKLINTALEEAIGRPGEPGDPEYIVWVAATIGITITQSIKWASNIRCAYIEPPLDALAPKVAMMIDDYINKISSFPKEKVPLLEDVVRRQEAGEVIEGPLDLSFKVTTGDGEDLSEAIARVGGQLIEMLYDQL